MAVSTKPKSKKQHAESNGKGKLTVGAGPYPMISLDQIQIVERPAEGEEHTKLFYNPRFVESFDSASMSELRESIKQIGLLKPLVVRINMDEEYDAIQFIELIAGERRFRCIQYLVEHNEDVYDKDLDRMVPASELYSSVPCCVHYNVDDKRALRIACDENGKSKNLSVKEEIALVERLVAMGKEIQEIIELTGQHPSWVSHRMNFRKKLPSLAYTMLIEEKLSPNVAVRIIGFDEADRPALLEATIEAEREATECKVQQVDDEIAEADDVAQLAERKRKKAIESGDKAGARKAEKTKETAEKKKAKAKVRKGKIEAHAGKISQGNLEEGARKAHVNPKTPKPLSKQDINACIVEPLDRWIEEGYTDLVYREDVPDDVLKGIRAVAIAFGAGDRDPASLVRKVMIAMERWEDQDAFSAAEADFKASGDEDDGFDDDFDNDE